MHDLGIQGYRLESVQLGGALMFRLARGSSRSSGPPPFGASVLIERSFTLETDSFVGEVDPVTWRNIERLAPLFMQEVTRCVCTPDGQLTLEFPGHTIRVVNETQYEPWEVRKDDGSLVVAVPGGELAMWGPSGSRPRPVDRRPGRRTRR
jgi:hypothetical protein